MDRAATGTGLTINKEKLLVTARDNAVVALAPVDGDKDVMLFMYASFAAGSCANTFATGYYRVRVVPASNGIPTTTEYINGDGKVVATGSLTSEERQATEAERDKLEVGIQLRHTEGTAQVAQTAATAQAVRTIFGVCRCQWIPIFRWRRLHSVIV